MMVEVEIDSFDQLELTLNERPDIVLLDNMGMDDCIALSIFVILWRKKSNWKPREASG